MLNRSTQINRLLASQVQCWAVAFYHNLSNHYIFKIIILFFKSTFTDSELSPDIMDTRDLLNWYNPQNLSRKMIFLDKKHINKTEMYIMPSYILTNIGPSRKKIVENMVFLVILLKFIKDKRDEARTLLFTHSCLDQQTLPSIGN